METLMKDFQMETDIRRKAESELTRVLEENRHFRQALNMHAIDLDQNMLHKIGELKDREKLDMRHTLAFEASEKLKANEQIQAMTLEL